ncbi:MAG: polyphenol oxidase family protein [Rectinemataceae bacterium]
MREAEAGRAALQAAAASQAASAPDHLEFSFPIPATARAAFLPQRPRALLSLRAAGSMRYLLDKANPERHAFLAAMGLAPERMVATELHHTRRVRLIEALPEGLPTAELPAEWDAAMLQGLDFGDGGPDGSEGRDGILLAGALSGGFATGITVADCMPIWIWDSASGARGVLHSGWKGTGILEVAVRALAERFGTRAEDLSVILGPAIGACCYTVPPERALAFEEAFGPASVVREGQGKEGGPRLDLRAANLGIARRLGIEALLSVDSCSSCDPELGSFRREGPEHFSRMLALCV